MPRSRAVRRRDRRAASPATSPSRRRRSRPAPTRGSARERWCATRPMMPSGTRPRWATISRIRGCSAPGVAICSAAEPLSPWAQMLPSPRKLAAASGAVVDGRHPAGHLAREHRAEDQAEAPVEPRAHQREERHQATAARGVAGTPASRRMSRPIGGERRQHVAGDDHQRHLQRERDQFPESAAPDVDDVAERRRRAGQRRADHDRGGQQREDERVGNPSLRPGGQREREPRQRARRRVGPARRVSAVRRTRQSSPRPVATCARR